MRKPKRYAGVLSLTLFGALVFLVAAGGLFYVSLEPADQDALRSVLSSGAVVLALLVVLLFVVLGSLVHVLYGRYVEVPTAYADELALMTRANPSRRVEPSGSPELRALGASINTVADRYQALQEDVAVRMQEARADMEEERNRLAALMSELTQGVVVCNAEGRILLYNSRAKRLLSQAPAGTASTQGTEATAPTADAATGRAASAPEAATLAATNPPATNGAGALVGLGRSIFGVLDRDLILHALENLTYQLHHDKPQPVWSFVTAAQAGNLVRASAAPVVGPDQEISGFVLTLEDITATVEHGARRNVLLRSLVEGTRSSLGSIRAAIESLRDYPDMPPERSARLSEVIHQEAIALSYRLDEGMADFSEHSRTQWPLEDMRGTDLAAILERYLRGRVGVEVDAEVVDDALWVRVDSYSVSRAVGHLAERLREEFAVEAVRLRITRGERMAELDIVSPAPAVQVETVRRWETEPLDAGSEADPSSVRDVMERHGGDVWYQPYPSGPNAYFRLLLPLTQPSAYADVRVASESRPEYYDFDLFRRAVPHPELDHVPLTDLTYTVFDTETTGLDPSGGDEIISVGAIRIVNGRLLKSEIFDQLIDPRRSVSAKSVEITGITQDMLRGQPTIEQVLPQFHRFAEETVLVAHNAAFDLRFFQLKEEQTCVRLTNPVLDTLLLSAVLHPHQDVHRLETIAERLGINLMGRHTSLGDAILTGEAFLKMIPLLAERGIHTLQQAREATEATYFARIEY